MPLSRALNMVERGEIQDGKTSLALLYAAGFRAGSSKLSFWCARSAE